MRKNRALTSDRGLDNADQPVDPSWTKPLFQSYVTDWAGNYLLFRAAARFDMKKVDIDPGDNHADEKAADAWAMAYDKAA